MSNWEKTMKEWDDSVPDGIKYLSAEKQVLMRRVRELESENARLKDAQRWIPVSERLPEANECVLVYDTFGNMTVDFIVTSGEVEKYFWLAKSRILFWMPLPESPNDTQTQAIVYGKESE